MILYQVRWADWTGTHYAVGTLVREDVPPHGRMCVRDAKGILHVGYHHATLYIN